MFELPLFPLETVLFPGMTLNLHIFEERYKQMINLCLETRQPFGVVLIKEGQEALGPLATPHPVGCTAQIMRMQPRGQGRMDIAAVGQERFTVQSLDFNRPYLVAMVELSPIVSSHAAALQRAGARLRPLVERYLEILARIGNLPFHPQQLPADPIQLGYLAAAILQQVPQTKKQEMLASDNAVDMLKRIKSIYYREVMLIDMMIARANHESDQGSFSSN